MIQRDREIIDYYLHRPELTVGQIGELFGVSQQTVTRIARVNNIPRRTPGRRVLKRELIDKIVEEYLSGKSLLAIQREHGLYYDIVRYTIENNTSVRVSSAKRSNPQLIEDYFEKIDTKEKAYWLGWMISDGAVGVEEDSGRGRHDISLTISERDGYILSLLEKDLGVSGRVYKHGKKYKRFSLGCKKMVGDLVNLGIVQNKTFIVDIPPINPELQSHLLRGIFDGDGCYTARPRRGGISRELSFCGNEFTITSVKRILESHIPELGKRPVCNERSIKRIRWAAKRDIALIAKYLYRDCGDHFLRRKKELIYADIEITD